MDTDCGLVDKVDIARQLENLKRLPRTSEADLITRMHSLLDGGAVVEPNDLSFAARWGYIEVLREMLAMPGVPEQCKLYLERDAYGDCVSPLFTALSYPNDRSVEAVDMLLASGFDPRESGWDVSVRGNVHHLHWGPWIEAALKRSHMAEYLLSHHAPLVLECWVNEDDEEFA